MTTMKKREYIRPSASTIELLETCMICASIQILNKETNSEGRAQGLNHDNWDDLWDDLWE